ncbi:hypothetical protein [Paenibacillus brevis]|uniref:Uncharacterized protein n=1 Tax=Paenibacillus brevis TaxID=2841508 RepID=A0ABS6FVM9_9BACL|nr:hypothetical protein [Paenibacillus brevis]MBU5673200.1 hypothetical protein [Paenibacillus brevis]
MKRFRWMRQSSRAAVISATVTRVILQGVSVEAALELSLPHYSINPGAISQLEFKRLLRDSKLEFKRIEETRRDGTGRRRMRG